MGGLPRCDPGEEAGLGPFEDVAVGLGADVWRGEREREE